MSLVIAEAGNTRDRGAFIDLVRAVLTDLSPEIRASAAYALAKLRPDATDTPAILTLLRDPVSNVRAGGWSAGWLSSDPTARLVARRVPVRPSRQGYAHDDPSRDYAPEALGFALPAGAEYLRLTSDRRDEMQLEFLIPAPQADVQAWAATLGPVVPLTDLLASDPATAALALGFLDAVAFGDPQVLRLPPDGHHPLRLVLIYRDNLFSQTGIAVIFGEKRSLLPPEPTVVAEIEPDGPADSPLSDEVLRLSGFKPDAPGEESDLFTSILLAHGYGAEDYLELYPNGAYAAEAREILAGPRLTLDDVSYADTDLITVGFANLPPGTTSDVAILNVANDYATEFSQTVGDPTLPITLDTEAGLAPGVYLMEAQVRKPDGGEPLILRRDFSITAGLAELAVDKTDFAPGEAINVRFSGMSGDSQDYIATAAIGSPNESYATYVYTAGVRDGVAMLLAPTTPGDYEIRAFFREDETVIRASLPITVTGTAPVKTVVTPTDGEPSPDARATLVLNKSVYAPGEAIIVTYSGMFGDNYDYLATVAAGAPLNAYLQYVYTQSVQEGTATLKAPTVPGAYEVRAFFKEDESILRGSVPFEVK